MPKRRYKIAIAGAIDTGDCGLDTLELAKNVGRSISKRGHITLTGAHHGFPRFAALGARERGGIVLYFSPAANLEEHNEVYRLDSDNADTIIYTGFGPVGSGLFLSRSADAVILGLGKIDGLHEFTLALEEGKPVGILRGDWQEDEIVKRLTGSKPKSHLPIVFDDDPDRLVEKLIEMVK